MVELKDGKKAFVLSSRQWFNGVNKGDFMNSCHKANRFRLNTSEMEK
jgi:hypothetical protein